MINHGMIEPGRSLTSILSSSQVGRLPAGSVLELRNRNDQPLFRLDESVLSFYPDPSEADQGSATAGGNRTVKDFINTIGSSPAVIVLISTGASGYTDYAVLTDLEIPSNILVHAHHGARFSIPAGVTLTINGLFKAGLYQVFAGDGSVVFGSGAVTEVYPEWWGNDAVALQSAIDAFGGTFGGIVSVGPHLIDIRSNTVTIKQGVTIRGTGLYMSGITMSGGSLSFGSYNVGRNSKIENLWIVNSSDTGNTINAGVLDGSDGPYNITIDHCRLSGGANTIFVDGAVYLTINNTEITNNVTGRHAIYADAIDYINQINLVNSRINGGCYFDFGTSGRELNIQGTIFESSYETLLHVVRTKGLTIHGSYFESNADGVLCLDIDQYVEGGSVKSNIFDAGSDTTNHINCDGTAVNFGANSFISIGSQDAINLEPNSKYCIISSQIDSGGGDGIPVVSDSGSYNKIFGYHTKSYWVTANELSESFGITLDTSEAGAPKIILPDSAENFGDFMVKLPVDIPKPSGVGSFQIYLWYRFSEVQSGNDVCFYAYSDFIKSGDTPGATNYSFKNVEADSTVLRSTEVRSGPYNSDDEFIQIKTGRAGTSGNDTFTGDVYLYGVEVRITNTLGY